MNRSTLLFLFLIISTVSIAQVEQEVSADSVITEERDTVLII
jgi:hypothetical protein